MNFPYVNRDMFNKSKLVSCISFDYFKSWMPVQPWKTHLTVIDLLLDHCSITGAIETGLLALELNCPKQQKCGKVIPSRAQRRHGHAFFAWLEHDQHIFRACRNSSPILLRPTEPLIEPGVRNPFTYFIQSLQSSFKLALKSPLFRRLLKFTAIFIVAFFKKSLTL